MSFINVSDVMRFRYIGNYASLKIHPNSIYVNVKCRAIIGGDLWRVEKLYLSLSIDFRNNILLLERIKENGLTFKNTNAFGCAGIGDFLYRLGYCVGSDHPYKYIGRKEYGWMFRMPRRKRLKLKWKKKKRKSTVNKQQEEIAKERRNTL